MKANEFVKQYGINEAKRIIPICEKQGAGLTVSGYRVNLDDLKRIIESHDYIESLGGYQFVKENLPFGYFGDGDYKDLIQKCLEDIESCK